MKNTKAKALNTRQEAACTCIPSKSIPSLSQQLVTALSHSNDNSDGRLHTITTATDSSDTTDVALRSLAIFMGPYPGSPDKTRDTLYVYTLYFFTNTLNSILLLILSRLPKLAVKPWIRSHPQPLILREVSVVDPTSASLLAGLQDVVIAKGHIQSIKPSASNIDLPSDVEDPIVVDLKGKYLCP